MNVSKLQVLKYNPSMTLVPISYILNFLCSYATIDVQLSKGLLAVNLSDVSLFQAFQLRSCYDKTSEPT